jgi:GNAT superfamily N-acetyltransferase
MAAGNIHYTQVRFGSEAYWQMVAVRRQQLRTPYGWDFTPEELATDTRDRHLAAVNGEGSIIATVILQTLSETEIRLRQVAVEAAWQNKGYGKALIAYAEQFAKTGGFTCAVLYARESAIAYYEQIGYQRSEGAFEDRGVTFKRLYKPL